MSDLGPWQVADYPFTPPPLIIPTYQLGPSLQEFIISSDGNPNNPLFDWGPVVTRACTIIRTEPGAGNTSIYAGSGLYTFYTPGVMSGMGIAIIGADNQSTIFQAQADIDILQGPTWNNGLAQGIQFQCRQDQPPVAGAGINLSLSNGCNVANCRFVGTWYGLFSQGCQMIVMQDCEAANFRKAGYWFAQASGQGKIIQLRKCGANPAKVSDGAALDATGYVFDGNLASITIDGFGGTGNSGDSVSYGDGMRFQNSFGGDSANLITIRNGYMDHWPNYGYNFGNWIGPPTALNTSPGVSASNIAKLDTSGLISTSAGTGCYVDAVNGFQGVGHDMSSNGHGYFFGVNNQGTFLSGCKTDSGTNVVFAAGYQGSFIAMACQFGPATLGGGTTGVNFSGGTVNNIAFIACGIRCSIPYDPATFGPNVGFYNCLGVNWQLGSVITPSFPSGATPVTNANPFPVLAQIHGGTTLRYTITSNDGFASFDSGVLGTNSSTAVIPPGSVFTATTNTGPWAWAWEGI